MNKIFITGNMVGEAKVKTLSSGKDLTSFSVAVSRKYKKEDGTYDTDFFNCTAFGKLGTDVIAKYGGKGQRVAIVGSMESNKKEEDGNKTTYWNVLVSEFELIGSKVQGSEEETKRPKLEVCDDDDGIPF